VRGRVRVRVRVKGKVRVRVRVGVGVKVRARVTFISTMVSAMSCLFLSCSMLVTMTTSGSSLVGAITMIISKGTALRKMRTW